MKKLLLVIVPLALVLVLGFLWSRLAGGGRGTEPDRGSTAETAPAPAGVPTDVTRIADPTERRDATTVRKAPDEATATLESATFAVAGALWIEGRVELPATHPPEPELSVVALSILEDDPTEWREEVERYGALELTAPIDERDREPAWAARTVAADGGFRIPVHPDATAALVMLDGDWLYAETPAEVDVAAGERSATLVAQTGGQLLLRYVPPTDASPDELATLTGTLVNWGGWGGMRRMVMRRGRLDETLELVCTALPADMQLWHGAETESFVPPVAFGLDVEAGRVLEKTVQLKRGVRLEGRVLDSAGAAIAGATVRARRAGNGAMMARNQPRTAETDSDGTFRVSAVPPGAIELDVTHENYVPEKRELGEIADGAVRTGVEVVLSAGNTVAGVARLGGGGPAPGATVRLKDVGPGDPERTALADVRKVEAEPDGRFTISGLGTGPFALKAEWSEADAEEPDAVPGTQGELGEPGESGEPEESREATAVSDAAAAAPEAPSWKAYVEDVTAGTTDLDLRLAQTIALPGRVQDERGQPVASFTVRARRQDVAISDQEQADFEDESGHFDLGGLVPGRWSVNAWGTGHSPSEPEDVFMPAAEPLVIELVRAASLAGRVTDPDGNPVEEARVLADLAGRNSENGETDAEGAFLLERVRAGHLTLRATSRDWAPSATLELELVAGEERTEVLLELTLGGRLTGVVYDEDGNPAEGRNVMIQGGSSGMGGEPMITGADGGFVREHVEPGTYQIFAMPDMAEMLGGEGGEPDMGAMLSKMKTATATVEDGQTTHVVLGAPPADPVVVRGRVTQAGEPVAKAFLAVVGEDQAMFDALRMMQTDDDGRYEITLDAPGNYTLIVGEGFGQSDGVEFNVVIPDTPEYRLDLALPLGGVRGRVVDGTGRGIEGLSVSWERHGALTTLGAMTGVRSARTNASGQFELESLHPGTYTLRAGSAPWQSSSENQYGRVVVEDVVVREDEIVEGLVIELPAAGRVQGHVRDATGAPVRGAVVHVRDSAGRLLAPLSRTTSDAGGEFRVAGVPPGDVTVSARMYADTTVSAEVGPFQVAEGQDTEIELVLEPGTMLVVAVEDAEGNLLRSFVEVTDAEGRRVSGLASADFEQSASAGFSSTEERVGPLPAGRYRVSATTPDGRSTSRPVTLRGGPEKTVRLKLDS